ncbi:MAG: hypothetical protein ACXW0H_06100, partial [Methylobacter sp.]
MTFTTADLCDAHSEEEYFQIAEPLFKSYGAHPAFCGQITTLKIFEDNVPQEIGSFSKGEVPTNYSLVIDNSGSLRFQLDKVIEAGKIIVGTNRPDDQTSVVRFVSSEKIEIVQDFTPNKID